MTDEQTLITSLEAANTEELAQLILSASANEEKVLRIYLGDARFRRLRDLVLRRTMARNDRQSTDRVNVVVIPGLLGSEITSVDRTQRREQIWLSTSHIVAGHLDRLRLDAHGLTETNRDYALHVTGIMKRYYGELMLALAEHYNVRAFWYDWRKDFRLAAAQLQAQIDNWFPAGEPVHLVAHAAGGLVARAYIHQFPQRWVLKHAKLGCSKLIMIGTPNQGSYSAIQAITGHLGLIRWIDLLDTRHDRANFRELVKSFPSLYQMLPAPGFAPPTTAALYEATTYGPELNLSQEHLDNAYDFHTTTLKAAPVDPTRMLYIAGHNQPTYVDVKVAEIAHFPPYRQPDAQEDLTYLLNTYKLGLNGDGTVPHPMGLLRAQDGMPIPAYYVDALHGDLCCNPKVLMAIHELLATEDWPQAVTAGVGGLLPLTPDLINEPNAKQAQKRMADMATNGAIDRQHGQHTAFEALVRRINSRSNTQETRHFMTVEERDIEERLMFGFLSGDAERARNTYGSIDLGVPTIKINLIQADITDNRLKLANGASPIDALALGHYCGGKPHGILRTLDYKISSAIEGKNISDRDINSDEELPSQEATRALDAHLLLTQYAQRGTLRSELAHTFFLADPRNTKRVIAIAGMGEPGRFGAPELTVLVRELCWSLGRMGKNHLATVLIGVGRDNLSVSDAVDSWIHGIKLAISGMRDASEPGKRAHALQEITFFVTDPRKHVAFDEALLREKAQLSQQQRMEIEYKPLTQAKKVELRRSALAYVQRQMEVQLKTILDQSPQKERAPTRITVSVEGNKYRFGAITEQASIPEREIPLDPGLVCRANDELAAAVDPAHQLDLGQFMQRLLIPADLRSQLTTNAPLVMMLDAATARIHWELLAQSQLASESLTDAERDEPHRQFLGTSRGFTRQLRTVHAPPPEPPPPAQRHLRVLVVADPAEDAHLAGAEEEGVAVADLFEQFNIIHAHNTTKNRVEVVRLFGPREATRTTVLRHLMLRTYDVLHFAGHCVYDKANPAASGWIFSNGERLSAYEFTRIDRSPAFVFSNACESGITPARSDERSVDLAPSFAESFFARGVTNFVCTAWPVDDRAARDFALTLYAGLLGLETPTATLVARHSRHLLYQAGTPLVMHEAMRRARVAIATPPSDTRTWGAYQHYGNPYFRFFDPAGMCDEKKRVAPQRTNGSDTPVAEHQRPDQQAEPSSVV